MTPKQIRLALFAALALLGPMRPAHAWFWEQAPDKTVTVRYRLSVAATVSTAAVVIDLSDTTNWPHKETGQINISSIRVDVDKVAASTPTVKLGVVNFVDSSTGSITWFYSKERVLNVSNTDIRDSLNYLPSFLKLKVIPGSGPTNGTTPYILSNDTTSGSTTYQTDVNLPSPNGNTAPGRGDVVLSVVNNDATNAVVANIEIQYHTDKP